LEPFLKVLYVISRKLSIRGRVQGVGFRYSLREAARRAGVTGWVRNCTDGSVEAVVQGPPERVDELIAWARRGPPNSRVDEVEVAPAEGEPAHPGFEMRPTV
jgi:acylphosphatase